ncbi:flagellar export chaperone FliS [Litorivicinus lipolyticus]|uniref:flagellar export chaperone FliS n=1 Tax=Litorivicinus lipolyticus TaxID=418701 RepID=UPI0014783571|nr:flagellar export chaperone FliS [Litorivicinus lipolyticus]
MTGTLAAKAYSNVNVSSQSGASKSRLILMLLDGALARMGAGEAAIQRKDFEAKATNLTRAMDITLALKASLDMESGGKLARNLKNVYDFVERTLLLVIARNDLEKLAQCRLHLNTIREGWVTVVDSELNPG